MPKSVRLGRELEKRLAEAAQARGVPSSVLIREAIVQICDDILERNLRTELIDVIGTIDSSGGRAGKTGEAFKRLLSSRSNHDSR